MSDRLSDRRDAREKIVLEHDATDAGSLSEEIICAIVRHSEREHDDLHPLGEHLDPDAIDALFEGTATGTPRVDAQLAFRYEGYRVDVDTNGLVQIQRVS